MYYYNEIRQKFINNWVYMSIKNFEIINYYIQECIQYNLSKRQLREKNKEYERLDDDTKNKLISNGDYQI